jgi:predicted nucleic acid-binding protein
VVPFGTAEAALSAKIYRSVRPRGRGIDIAIAATAILRDAHLWTLNANDFCDLGQIRLWQTA